MQKAKISIVVPVFNEELNIEELYSQICSIFLKTKYDFELIYVDDGSTDDTASRVALLHSKDSRIKLLSFSRNFGHQIALSAGMDHATGDATIVMDADLQHPPEFILNLIEKWEAGYEIVYTVRVSNSDANFLKKETAYYFYRVFRWLSKIEMPANTADFRLMDKKVILAFGKIRERTRFLRGLTTWIGYSSIGVPYEAKARNAGHSKYGLIKMLRLAVDGIVSFSARPLYFAIYFRFALAFFGFLYTFYVLYQRFIIHDTVQGWSSIVILCCLIGGLQLILMGLSGIYIGRIYEEVKQRPLYLIKESLGFDSFEK